MPDWQKRRDVVELINRLMDEKRHGRQDRLVDQAAHYDAWIRVEIIDVIHILLLELGIDEKGKDQVLTLIRNLVQVNRLRT
jgi:hypothetical protein